MGASKSSAGFLLLLGVVIGLVSSSEAYVFYAGGRSGWVLHPSEDYDHWAGRNRFQVNDTIVFKYPEGKDSVLVVTEKSYGSCNLTNPIRKFHDGNSVFKFDRSGPFYFISGTADNCKKGQKLTIVVLAVRNKTPTEPPTSPAPSRPPFPTPRPKPPSSSPAHSPSPSIHVPSPVHSPSPSPAHSPAPLSTPPVHSPAPLSISPVHPPSPSPYSSKSPSPSPVISATPSTSPAYSPNSSPSSSESPSPSSNVSGPGEAPAPSPSLSAASSTSVLSRVSFGLVSLILFCAFVN